MTFDVTTAIKTLEGFTRSVPSERFESLDDAITVLLVNRNTLRTAVKEMLAEAKQVNYDRAGKSEFDEGREVAYQYVLDLMDGGRS